MEGERFFFFFFLVRWSTSDWIIRIYQVSTLNAVLVLLHLYFCFSTGVGQVHLQSHSRARRDQLLCSTNSSQLHSQCSTRGHNPSPASCCKCKYRWFAATASSSLSNDPEGLPCHPRLWSLRNQRSRNRLCVEPQLGLTPFRSSGTSQCTTRRKVHVFGRLRCP